MRGGGEQGLRRGAEGDRCRGLEGGILALSTAERGNNFWKRIYISINICNYIFE